METTTHSAMPKQSVSLLCLQRYYLTLVQSKVVKRGS